MKKGASILVEDDDKYMYAPCNTEKSFVVQLSEDIIVDTVVISNLEHYSSTVKMFDVLASESHPTENWRWVARLSAEPRNGDQTFELAEGVPARYLKFHILAHYGDEYYCTLTYLRIHGRTMLESLKDDLDRNDIPPPAAEGVKSAVSGAAGVESAPPPPPLPPATAAAIVAGTLRSLAADDALRLAFDESQLLAAVKAAGSAHPSVSDSAQVSDLVVLDLPVLRPLTHPTAHPPASIATPNTVATDPAPYVLDVPIIMASGSIVSSPTTGDTTAPTAPTEPQLPVESPAIDPAEQRQPPPIFPAAPIAPSVDPAPDTASAEEEGRIDPENYSEGRPYGPAPRPPEPTIRLPAPEAAPVPAPSTVQPKPTPAPRSLPTSRALTDYSFMAAAAHSRARPERSERYSKPRSRSRSAPKPKLPPRPSPSAPADPVNGTDEESVAIDVMHGMGDSATAILSNPTPSSIAAALIASVFGNRTLSDSPAANSTATDSAAPDLNSTASEIALNETSDAAPAFPPQTTTATLVPIDHSAPIPHTESDTANDSVPIDSAAYRAAGSDSSDSALNAASPTAAATGAAAGQVSSCADDPTAEYVADDTPNEGAANDTAKADGSSAAVNATATAPVNQTAAATASAPASAATAPSGIDLDALELTLSTGVPLSFEAERDRAQTAREGRDRAEAARRLGNTQWIDQWRRSLLGAQTSSATIDVADTDETYDDESDIAVNTTANRKATAGTDVTAPVPNAMPFHSFAPVVQSLTYPSRMPTAPAPSNKADSGTFGKVFNRLKGIELNQHLSRSYVEELAQKVYLASVALSGADSSLAHDVRELRQLMNISLNHVLELYAKDRVTLHALQRLNESQIERDAALQRTLSTFRSELDTYRIGLAVVFAVIATLIVLWFLRWIWRQFTRLICGSGSQRTAVTTGSTGSDVGTTRRTGLPTPRITPRSGRKPSAPASPTSAATTEAVNAAAAAFAAALLSPNSMLMRRINSGRSSETEDSPSRIGSGGGTGTRADPFTMDASDVIRPSVHRSAPPITSSASPSQHLLLSPPPAVHPLPQAGGSLRPSMHIRSSSEMIGHTPNRAPPALHIPPPSTRSIQAMQAMAVADAAAISTSDRTSPITDVPTALNSANKPARRKQRRHQLTANPPVASGSRSSPIDVSTAAATIDLTRTGSGSRSESGANSSSEASAAEDSDSPDQSNTTSSGVTPLHTASPYLATGKRKGALTTSSSAASISTLAPDRSPLLGSKTALTSSGAATGTGTGTGLLSPPMPGSSLGRPPTHSGGHHRRSQSSLVASSPPLPVKAQAPLQPLPPPPVDTSTPAVTTAGGGGGSGVLHSLFAKATSLFSPRRSGPVSGTATPPTTLSPINSVPTTPNRPELHAQSHPQTNTTAIAPVGLSGGSRKPPSLFSATLPVALSATDCKQPDEQQTTTVTGSRLTPRAVPAQHARSSSGSSDQMVSPVSPLS